MTWVAFERAGRMARQRGLPAAAGAWREAADRAYLHVQERGWNPRARLRAVPRQHTLDASALVMPLVQFSGAERPAVPVDPGPDRGRAGHRQPGHRYHTAARRLRRPRGHLQPVLVLVRRGAHPRRAAGPGAAHFEKMLTYANHLGLYAEEIGSSGEALGQLPAGLHPPGPDQRGRQPGPGAGDHDRNARLPEPRAGRSLPARAEGAGPPRGRSRSTGTDDAFSCCLGGAGTA